MSVIDVKSTLVFGHVFNERPKSIEFHEGGPDDVYTEPPIGSRFVGTDDGAKMAIDPMGCWWCQGILSFNNTPGRLSIETWTLDSDMKQWEISDGD